MSAFVFWFLCGVVYLLLFGQLSPRKKKSFKQVTDGMFIFCLYSFPTYFLFYKVCIAAVPHSFRKLIIISWLIRTSKLFFYCKLQVYSSVQLCSCDCRGFWKWCAAINSVWLMLHRIKLSSNVVIHLILLLIYHQEEKKKLLLGICALIVKCL